MYTYAVALLSQDVYIPHKFVWYSNIGGQMGKRIEQNNLVHVNQSLSKFVSMTNETSIYHCGVDRVGCDEP